MLEDFSPNPVSLESEPTKAWQVIGRLEANGGHTFRIFFQAEKKANLDEFLKKVKDGEIAFQVEILPVEPDDKYQRSFGEEPPASDESVIETDGVSIGISRLELNPETLPNPYRIRYIIDPPLKQGKTFSATFQDQIEANIRCDVQAGNVSVELWKLRYDMEPIGGAVTRTVSKDNHVQIDEPSFGNRNWKVVVTGNSADNTFSLSYDKVVA
jgi:hypothetical protein